MTAAETARIIQMVIAFYPSSKVRDDDLTIKLWHEMLADLPFDMVDAATKRMVSTLKFPPTIADIRGAVADAMSEAKGEISAGDAWARVRKAISRFGYYQPEKAREWLGERIWHAVDMIGGWTYINTTEDGIATLSAQFERRYNAAVEQRKHAVQIPQSTRDAMAGMVARMEGMGGEQQALPDIHALSLDQQAQALRLQKQIEEAQPMSGFDGLSIRELRQKEAEAEQRRQQELDAGRPQFAAVCERLRDKFRKRIEDAEAALHEGGVAQ